LRTCPWPNSVHTTLPRRAHSHPSRLARSIRAVRMSGTLHQTRLTSCCLKPTAALSHNHDALPTPWSSYRRPMTSPSCWAYTCCHGRNDALSSHSVPWRPAATHCISGTTRCTSKNRSSAQHGGFLHSHGSWPQSNASRDRLRRLQQSLPIKPLSVHSRGPRWQSCGAPPFASSPSTPPLPSRSFARTLPLGQVCVVRNHPLSDPACIVSKTRRDNGHQSADPLSSQDDCARSGCPVIIDLVRVDESRIVAINRGPRQHANMASSASPCLCARHAAPWCVKICAKPCASSPST